MSVVWPSGERVVVCVSMDPVKGQKSRQATKILVSSLQRSLSAGHFMAYRNQETPLFRIDRKHFDEIPVNKAFPEKDLLTRRQRTREYLFRLGDLISPAAGQWLMIADSGGVALRNIDHLLPIETGMDGPARSVDFYWTRIGERGNEASTGLWAVRGDKFRLVLDAWRRAYSRGGIHSLEDDARIWSEVVQSLPIKKRSFEAGEVLAPSPNGLNWSAVSKAAFVTVPDWQPGEQQMFLQALYFSVYLGDESGLMLDLIDA